jgi:hypothetical protein
MIAALLPRPASGQEASEEFAGNRPIRVGVIGSAAFPRPLAIEGVIGLGRRAILGVEYATTPAITIAHVRTTVWGVAGDARIFPFRGPFFLGLRAGVQHLDGSDSVSSGATGPLTASLAATTWYVNPRVGVLWTFDPGITIGLNAGVQIPVADSETTSPTTVPGAPSQAVSSAVGQATSATDVFVRRVVPTFDLLQLGYVY